MSKFNVGDKVYLRSAVHGVRLEKMIAAICPYNAYAISFAGDVIKENNPYPHNADDYILVKEVIDSRINTATAGYKNDDDKLRMDLIPPEAMFALASILTHGANKYPDRNWERGMKYTRVFGAAMRHAWCWFGGKGPTNVNFVFGTMDEDSGFSHLWHLLACVVFLVTYEERNMTENDDRYNWGEDNG